MWDKKYRFPLTVIKDTLHLNVAIDDDMNNGNDDETLSIGTKTNSRSNNVAKKSMDNAIAKAIKQRYHEQRGEWKEFIDTIKNLLSTNKESASSQIGSVIGSITQTQQSITSFEKELDVIKGKKRKLKLTKKSTDK